MATLQASMSKKRYTDEFKAEATKQVIERGFTVVDETACIGIPKRAIQLGAGGGGQCRRSIFRCRCRQSRLR
jgi:hypothetical protein